MDWWFDFAVTGLSNDGCTVQTDFRRGPKPTGNESPEVARRMLGSGESVGALTVTFGSREAGKPVAVELELPNGIAPSTLARFAWTYWLAHAAEVVRAGPIEVPSERLGEAFKVAAGRPGRRGHPLEFLDKVARRYRDLRLAGERAPVATIAAEAGVSRNTAAGWIKQARQRGLLASPRRS